MTHGAANNPSQDVSATFIGRSNSVNNKKGTRADVVGDHPQGIMMQISRSGYLRNVADQFSEQIYLIVAVDMLKNRSNALKARTGINRWLWQWRHTSISFPFELHENQIPDFDVAITVLIRTARRTSCHIRPVIIEDFRAGAAGPGIAHRPEIVFFTQTREALRIDFHLIQPNVSRFIIILIDSDPESASRQSKLFSKKFPRKLNSLSLEIITERKIAQHLKKRVMTSGIAHVLQIVVLATRSYTSLGTGRPGPIPLFISKKYVLELNHTRIGEQQSRIIGRNQGAA